MTDFAVAQLEEIDEIDDGRCAFRPVRQHFGISSFGVNAWTARAAGDQLINEHDEADDEGSEELYLVLRGRASFELDGERFGAPTGTFVYAPPKVKRAAFAEEPGTTVVAIGAASGRIYQPLGWELFAPVRPLYEAGEYAEAADRGGELLADDPPYAGLYYNVACCESLAGRPEDAIAHLRRAVELSSSARSFIKDDPDLDPLRDDPAFQALLEG